MINAQKHNLRMINMKNHTVHTLVKQYNLITKYPDLVKPEKLPNPSIFSYLVSRDFIDNHGKISERFDFSSKSLFEGKGGEKYKEYQDKTMDVLKTVG